VEARLRDLKDRLAASGLDLFAPFPRDGRCGIVVGNTRALWAHFVPTPGPDPLDRYVVRVVEEAVGALGEIYWAHTMPPTVAIQREAERAGLAWLSPSHLSVHVEYGPWIALRALVVCDLPVDAVEPAKPCCDCARGCGPALACALAAGSLDTREDLQARWKLWLDVRDACPRGRAHRYSDAQIAHHYGLAKVQIPGV
jgi:hypothetical protein